MTRGLRWRRSMASYSDPGRGRLCGPEARRARPLYASAGGTARVLPRQRPECARLTPSRAASAPTSPSAIGGSHSPPKSDSLRRRASKRRGRCEDHCDPANLAERAASRCAEACLDPARPSLAMVAHRACFTARIPRRTRRRAELHERLVPVPWTPSAACTSCSAIFQTRALPRALLMSSSIAKSRARTRATLPSTTAARLPNAMLATAPAV